jgi:tRNA-specific 2-thiouridylase
MRTVVGDAASGGDWAWIRLAVDRGRIVDASGEGGGARALCARVAGLTPLEAAAVPGDGLALDALHAALAPVAASATSEARVVVALSGGVDSAVALLRARDEGYDPVGVTLRLWVDPAASDGDRACCSPSAVRAARSLCHELGVPHLTLDRRDAFRRTVVREFVRGYARGDTPNPCAGCNGGFRFRELLTAARRLGASRVATGHYARVVEREGRLLVARSADPLKDQSYMLATVDPSVLDRVWFPLGGQTKGETRDEAVARRLAAAHRAESQEACFLGGDDYRAFLERQGVPEAPGPILDRGGRMLGTHGGAWRFTPGQRRGVGVASADGPLYVLETRMSSNTVVVGPRSALERRTVDVRPGRVYVAPDALGVVEAKLRHRSGAVAADVSLRPRGFTLHLHECAAGIARGQVAALYDGGAIVGAGRIVAAR